MVDMVALSYIPQGWSDKLFADNGGFVAVILNYNKSGMIADAARSALSQDFSCYEVLMLDDCSTDGSEQEMLSIAREYAAQGGRCKVTVVVNEDNQTILGQWKQSLALSPSGRWFIMFCGDDTSRHDRITILNSLAGAYPTAWGICTNFNPSNRARYTEKTGVQVWRGCDSERPIPHFYGCAAMWRREVLDVDLPMYNLDDFFLFWSVIIRRQGLDEVALVWDLSHVCVDYSVGTGITTEIAASMAPASKSWLARKWREGKIVHNNAVRFGLSFWNKIIFFDNKYGHSGIVRDQIHACLRLAEMDARDWLSRIWIYLRFVLPQPSHVSKIAREIRRRFYERVFGNYSYVAYAFLEKLKNG